MQRLSLCCKMLFIFFLDAEPDIEAAIVAKYLGIEINIQGRNLIKPRESRMIGGARTYAHTIMGCTRSGLDRALTAYRLWESCAVPGFLYDTGAMVISKTTVKELEKIQHLVSWFILQLPQSSSQVMGWMETGLQPIQQCLDTRTVLFAHALMTGKKDQLTKYKIWAGSQRVCLRDGCGSTMFPSFSRQNQDTPLTLLLLCMIRVAI